MAKPWVLPVISFILSVFCIIVFSIDGSYLVLAQEENSETVYNYLNFDFRKMILSQPERFTEEWYTNEQYNFAVKFPSHVKGSWEIVEYDDYIIIFSKKSSAKVKIGFWENQEFSDLIKHDKEELFNTFTTLIHDTFESPEYEIQIDSIGVTKFKDGMVVTYSFYIPKTNKQGVIDFELNDYTLFIFDDGRIYDLLYVGDNYETLSFQNVYQMINRFWVGDVSVIPLSAKLQTGVYTNNELRFSIKPPENWSRQVSEEQFLGKFFLPVVFSNENEYDGSFSPYIAILYLDSGTDVDLKASSDQEIVDGMIEGFLGTKSYETKKLEISSTSVERGDNFIKVGSAGLIQLPDNLLDAKLELTGWIFEGGESYMVILYADPLDYDQVVQEYRNSVTSFDVEPKPPRGITTEEPSLEYDIGYWIGYYGAFILVGSIIVTGILFGIKRRNKKEKTSMS